MQQHKDSAVLAYIRHVLDVMGISPSALAKRANISSTTLTRPLNNSEYKFNLSATTIEKIAAVSGVNPGPFFEGKDYPSVALATYFDPTMHDPKITGEMPSDHSTIVVVGSAALGMWQEIGLLHSQFIGSLFVAPTIYSAKNCFAVVLKDSHAGLFAYQDDVVLCVRLEAYDRELNVGDTVLVERRKESGRLIEMTVRSLQKIKTGWQFSTLDRRGAALHHQFALEDLAGTEEARIAGVVLCAIRYPP